MIIIPSLETVIIQPPRTGSTSLRVAIAEKYPDSIIPYHHMERAGIPDEYNSFNVIGIVRNPIKRLYSIYKYMRTYENPNADQEWIKRMREDSNRSFVSWLWNSSEIFTDVNIGEYNKKYEVLDLTPITRKSQSLYIQPELGPVEILKLEDVLKWEKRLNIKLPKINCTDDTEVPNLYPYNKAYLNTFFEWDMRLYGLS